MRDGARLATDVHGAGDAPRPVLLLRTPYGKSAASELAAAASSRGYVTVIQDTRGCFESEGEVDFLWPEAEDGYDTCAWIVEQPWCDGRIATVGASWSGWAQTAMAALDPPGLVAMVPVQSGARALQTSVRHRGAVELRFIAWAYWHAALNTRVDPPLPAPHIAELLGRLPLRAGETVLTAAPAYERWMLEIATSGDDDDRWRHPSVDYLSHAERAAVVPTLLMGGWFDSYPRATFELFTAMRGRGAPVHLIVGPWVHGTTTMEQSFAGDVDFGPSAAIDRMAVQFAFLDEHLQGSAVLPRAPVRIFVMGGGDGSPPSGERRQHGGQWREEQEWPLARTRWTTLHLQPGGGLGAEIGTGRTHLRVDPDDPVPTLGSHHSSLMDVVETDALHLSPTELPLRPSAVDPARLRSLAPEGAHDQRALGDRPDVLTFLTPPLDDPVEVTGSATVVVFLSSDAPDTDVTAKLIDVHPDGYAMNLTDSIVRLRYREGETAVSYTPGEVVRVEVELYPTSNLFAAGHRIRLDISGTNFPRFDPNPGTGEPLWQETRRVVQRNTVWHDAAHPSALVLPVIPAP